MWKIWMLLKISFETNVDFVGCNHADSFIPDSMKCCYDILQKSFYQLWRLSVFFVAVTPTLFKDVTLMHAIKLGHVFLLEGFFSYFLFLKRKSIKCLWSIQWLYVDKKRWVKLWQNKKDWNLFEMPNKNDVFFQLFRLFLYH